MTRWRMPYIHRSRARPALDFAVALPEGDDSISIESEDVQTEVPIPRVIVPQQRAGTTGSRFHIIARLSIVDRTLWLSPGKSFMYLYHGPEQTHLTERRPSARREDTHRWMLTVDSVSYVRPACLHVQRRSYM